MATVFRSGSTSVTRKMEALIAPFESDFETPEAAENEQTAGAGFEWGWFEDIAEEDNQESLSDSGLASSGEAGLFSSLQWLATASPSIPMESPTPRSLDMCRRLPPLNGARHTPYHRSKYPWVRVLPSYGHIEASIQIQSFRVVDSEAQYAEYLVEMRLDGRYFSRWRRFSELARFVSSLDQDQFQRAMEVWQAIEANSRWFYRLELSYLHKRCQMLEEFAHALLVECSDAHVLAELLECP